MKISIRTQEGYEADLDLGFDDFMQMFTTGWWRPPGHPGHKLSQITVPSSKPGNAAKVIKFD